MNNLTVERMKSEDALATSEMLARAFMTSPNTKAILRRDDDEKFLPVSAAVFRSAKLERTASTVLVARQESKIVGALNMAQWPRCQLSAGEKLKMMPKMIFSYGTALFRAMQLMGEWSKNDPKEKHWHYGPLGVEPALQGKGVGSRLLAAGNELVDRDRIAAYLETDKPENVRLYERFGFNVIKEVHVLGLTNWLMLRAPR